jgi:zinc/manganese transport system substrate-binding protein
VHSIIVNPDADPHDYEPTAADGRALARAEYVIENGVGYDPWIAKLVAANAVPQRSVLNDVHRVIEQICDDYKRIDPADAAYFDQQKKNFLIRGLARYHQLIADIKNTYHGTPIGASESIVIPLAEGLGLKLATPQSFLNAISEGTDPTAADKIRTDEQIKTKQIKIFVLNSQNSNPDVTALVTAAKDKGIPVVSITETPVPATASFQDWQSEQLRGIQEALSKATTP